MIVIVALTSFIFIYTAIILGEFMYHNFVFMLVVSSFSIASGKIRGIKYWNIALLIPALLITILLLPATIFYRAALTRDPDNFFYDTAQHFDVLWGKIFFNEDKTVSAVIFEKRMEWAIRIVNAMFFDKYHCASAWLYHYHEVDPPYDVIERVLENYGVYLHE